jgi:hypothetical protein
MPLVPTAHCFRDLVDGTTHPVHQCLPLSCLESWEYTTFVDPRDLGVPGPLPFVLDLTRMKRSRTFRSGSKIEPTAVWGGY